MGVMSLIAFCCKDSARLEKIPELGRLFPGAKRIHSYDLSEYRVVDAKLLDNTLVTSVEESWPFIGKTCSI
jgi:hypothetical protein